MQTGLIVKALSGYYYVLPDGGGEPVQCRARGVFKKRGTTPLVGDRVRFSVTPSGEGTVDEVFPRTTELVRPPVANADTMLLVSSVVKPDLSLLLMDRFLVHAEHAGLEAIVVITKEDLLDPAADGEHNPVEQAKAIYGAAGYTVLSCSVKKGTGLDEVRRALAGRLTVIAGQSGVGKSSLLNGVIPGVSLMTGEVSDKLGRGRHTTRHVELIAHPDGGFVADTPGFSQLDFAGIEAGGLSACFPEFAALADGCKFRGCLHQNEPSCAVMEAAEDGRVAESRYRHYLQFLAEIQQTKRRY
jgi:ribosome biogenesis GTPase